MNPFFSDSTKFMAYAAKQYVNSENNFDLIQTGLNLALGVERILKGILYDINPIYILKEQSFKNTAPILYEDKIIKDVEDKEISKKPDGDVLSFRSSLVRACYFSNSINTKRQFLYYLSSIRDIIAHRESDEIDIEKFKQSIDKDLYPFIFSLCEEKNFEVNNFFESFSSVLHSKHLRQSKKQEIKENLLKRISEHKDIWEKRKSDDGFITYVNDKISRLLTRTDLNYEIRKHPCPACNNSALVYLESECDIICCDEGKVIGDFIDSLACYYCEFEVSDYSELEILKITKNNVTR